MSRCLVFGCLVAVGVVACDAPSPGSATPVTPPPGRVGVESTPAVGLERHVERAATTVSPTDDAGARVLIRELRAARNNAVDALYTEYGKGEWRQLGERVVEHTVGKTAKTLTQGASKTEKVLVDQMLGLVDEAADNALADLERDVFQRYIVEVGEGKRSSALDDHTRQFFADPDVQRRCRDVASLGDQIVELERLIMNNTVRQRR